MTDFPMEPTYPWQDMLGFTVTGWGPDVAEITLPLAAKHGNRYGIPHGGVLASLLDTAMGFAGCYSGDPDKPILAMTLSMTTNFVAVSRGTVLVAQGRRTGGGAKTFFAEATVTDDTGAVIATATGVFRYRKGVTT
jgi:uncharacterized protein (TIGR00369 family)